MDRLAAIEAEVAQVRGVMCVMRVADMTWLIADDREARKRAVELALAVRDASNALMLTDGRGGGMTALEALRAAHRTVAAVLRPSAVPPTT